MTSKLCIVAISLFLASISFASQNSGLIAKESQLSFDKTLEKMEMILGKKGFKIFAKVDHSANAKKAGLKMDASTLLIFGNPKVGTPLMKASSSFGIDLPVKVLIYKDASGKVLVSYNNPMWLAQRHGAKNDLPQIKKMTMALDKMTSMASSK